MFKTLKELPGNV